MTAGAAVIAGASGCGADRPEQTAATGTGSTSEQPSVRPGRQTKPVRPTRGGLSFRPSRGEAKHERGATTAAVGVHSGGATRIDSSSAAEVIAVTKKALHGERGGERRRDRPDPTAVLKEEVRDALRGEGGPAAAESEAASDRVLHRAAGLLRRALAEDEGSSP